MEDIYTINTGSHDHCVYVYNEHRVSHDQFITMASLYYLYTFSCYYLYKLLPPDRVQNMEYSTWTIVKYFNKCFSFILCDV